MAKPIVREKQDEAGDHEDALRRFKDKEYLDWPNEAGFENLEEHRGPIELTIRGSFPAWTAGSLFRTGPGINQIEGTPCGPDGVLRIAHWFDGLAHTHRFDIVADDPDRHQAATRIVYSSRRQSDRWVAFVQKNGLRDCITFAQKADPCVGLFSKLMSTWKAAVSGAKTETAEFENVGVTVQLGVPGLPSQAAAAAATAPKSGGHRSPPTVWLGTDAHMLCEVDRTTLEPLGIARQRDLDPALDGPCSSAHAQRCPRTGDYFNINVKPGAAATYRIFRVSASTGKTEILATIRRLNLPMVYFHSFFLSAHYVIMCLPSSHIKAYGLGVLWEKNMLDAIIPFDKAKKCKWFVVDRVHGRGVVAEFETDAAFFFHTVNCFEEHNDDKGEVNIICDVVEYPNMDILHELYYDALGNFKAGSVFSILAPHVGELPTINPAYHTRPYRYVYSLAISGRSTLTDTIVKTDTATRQVVQWNNPHGHTPGEAIFVARPGATEEDDGVLLSVVLDGTSSMSYLLCLDARTMVETGRAEISFVVGLGFHGVHTTEM